MAEILKDELKTKQKRIWTRKWILRRGSHGVSVGLLRELESEDVIEYRPFLRMNTEEFDVLLRDIADKIQPSDTVPLCRHYNCTKQIRVDTQTIL